MLHIVICDDEPIIAEKIKNIIVSQMADTNENITEMICLLLYQKTRQI